MIVGASENGVVDPATGVNKTRAVLWNDGEISDLGSFGGNQNVAAAITPDAALDSAQLFRTQPDILLVTIALTGPGLRLLCAQSSDTTAPTNNQDPAAIDRTWQPGTARLRTFFQLHTIDLGTRCLMA
jgi:hypothetical protein